MSGLVVRVRSQNLLGVSEVLLAYKFSPPYDVAAGSQQQQQGVMSDALRNRILIHHLMYIQMFGAGKGYNLARECSVVGSEQRNK